MKALLVSTLVVAVAAGGVVPARAESAARGDVQPAKAEAQRRFFRGIELYKEANLGAALAEFKRAYELEPNYKILYNLGQVSYQRRDYAAALRYFRQYLGDGDNAVPRSRQNEVAADISDLEHRVGRFEIETTDDGNEVFVDDMLVGTTPLNTLIPVNVGRRKIDVVARSGEHRTRLVDVAGGEIARVSFGRLAVVQPPRPAAAPPPPRPSAPPPEPAAKAEPVAKSEPAAKAEPAAEPAPDPAPAAPPRKVALELASPPAEAKTEPAATIVSPISEPAPAAHKAGFPWKSWALTGLLAGGAAVTGVIAYQTQQDLDAQRTKFPADYDELDYDMRKTRGFALATDGLLLGTAIMTAVSLYLTFRD